MEFVSDENGVLNGIRLADNPWWAYSAGEQSRGLPVVATEAVDAISEGAAVGARVVSTPRQRRRLVGEVTGNPVDGAYETIYVGCVAFPVADTEEQYGAISEDEGVLRPAVLGLCDHLGIGTDDVERFPDGSLPVYAIGDRYALKLFPGVHLDEVPVERDVLRAVHGKLPVPTPGVEAAGEFEGWGYVLMRRLQGESLKTVWPRLDEPQRVKVASRVGEALAALHEVPAPEGLAPSDWDSFIAEQKAGCVERQRERKLDSRWLEQIPGFLDSVDLGTPKLALLHTEVMSDHLLVSPELTLSGLFDFEPAMRGAIEYEFVATGLFLTRGDHRAHRALLEGYGRRDIDDELPRRLLAYALLHVYSNPAWYLRDVPPKRETTLDALAEHWFGVHA